jgi:hypothetical protein
MVFRDLVGVDTQIRILSMLLAFELGLRPRHHRSGGVEQMRATLNAYCRVDAREVMSTWRTDDDDGIVDDDEANGVTMLSVVMSGDVECIEILRRNGRLLMEWVVIPSDMSDMKMWLIATRRFFDGDEGWEFALDETMWKYEAAERQKGKR